MHTIPIDHSQVSINLSLLYCVCSILPYICRLVCVYVCVYICVCVCVCVCVRMFVCGGKRSIAKWSRHQPDNKKDPRFDPSSATMMLLFMQETYSHCSSLYPGVLTAIWESSPPSCNDQCEIWYNL